MSDSMTGTYDRLDVIASSRRRRRRRPEENIRIAEETYLPGNSVSLVTRQHRIAGERLFTRRQSKAQSAITVAPADEQVVPASGHRALEAQVRELQRRSGRNR